MSGFKIKSDIIEKICGEICEKNKKMVDEMLKKGGEMLYSPEYIKYSFSEHLLEDIDFLQMLSNCENLKTRYAYIILRGMVEQVIEFGYLMRHTELIPEFMGSKIDSNKINKNSNNKIIKSVHKMGSERYSEGRASVSKMADEIGEKRSNGNQMSLYEIYQILSEECHNSYFFANLENIEGIEAEEKPLTEEQVQYLIIIIGRFMDIYRKD